MITTSVESRVEFPATRIQSLGSLLSVWANVSGTQSWVANGGRRACSAHPACPCREGLVAYLRALGTIIKRERARERTERGKTQKWQSRSLGPPRVLTRASPRVRTCLGPRSVPSTYAFLHHLPPSRSLTSLLHCVHPLEHPFRDGQPRGTFAHRRISWFVHGHFDRFSCRDIVFE